MDTAALNATIEALKIELVGARDKDTRAQNDAQELLAHHEARVATLTAQLADGTLAGNARQVEEQIAYYEVQLAEHS